MFYQIERPVAEKDNNGKVTNYIAYISSVSTGLIGRAGWGKTGKSAIQDAKRIIEEELGGTFKKK